MQEIKTVVLPLTELTVKKKEMHSVETGEKVVNPIEKAIQEYLDQGWTYHSMSIVPGVILRKRNWFKRTFSSKPQERYDASYYTLFFVREKPEGIKEEVKVIPEEPVKKHNKHHKNIEETPVVETKPIELGAIKEQEPTDIKVNNDENIVNKVEPQITMEGAIKEPEITKEKPVVNETKAK